MQTSCSNFVYEIIYIYYIYPTIMNEVNVSATVEEMPVTVGEMSVTVGQLNMF